MRLLVVGGSGHLGGEVCRLAVGADWAVVGSYHRRPGGHAGVRWQPLDIRDLSTVVDLVSTVEPDAVVNAAYAYDDRAVTADGAANVAIAAAAGGARLVHISSDVIHSGRAWPYQDDDPPEPLYPYGTAKADAEAAVRTADPSAVLVRTSLLVGDASSQHVGFCLDLLTGRRSGVLFADEIRCPIAVEDLSCAVLELARTTYAGPLNVAGPEPVSRAEFGHLVARRYGLDPAGFTTSTIAESGLVRPGRIELDSGRAHAMLRTRLRPVSELLG